MIVSIFIKLKFSSAILFSRFLEKIEVIVYRIVIGTSYPNPSRNQLRGVNCKTWNAEKQ